MLQNLDYDINLSNSTKEIRNLEYPIEVKVSKYIRRMPFIWIEINDPSGPKSLRGYIERNSIALLSNYSENKIDLPSTNWLGLTTKNSVIINSLLLIIFLFFVSISNF